MNPDFLVIGGGVIGLTIALELKRREPGARIRLLEKEAKPGEHASGRNSGVLHAGFYYTADSLKARFTREGNRALTQYCVEKGLKINRCGKLVVAKDAGDLEGLRILAERGRKNGVELQELSAAEAERMEPRAKTFEKALFSPTTSSVDPGAVMASLAEDARAAGIEISCGVAYTGRSGAEVRTSAGSVSPGYVVNAAGLYADRIARDFGCSQHYTILPFKGLYLYSSEPAGALKVHIYPVPDLKYPFLGVHYTITVDGKIKIGPTAMPAFWREHYTGVARFDLGEFLEISTRELGLMFNAGFDFRGLARAELKKYSRRVLVEQAARLMKGVRLEDYTHWGRPGIRAQLLDLRTRKLEMDFVVETGEHSLHVLNAVSPAFTCSLPIAGYISDMVLKKQ